MGGIAFWFFLTAAGYAVVGMVWGVVMGISGDFGLAPAHAHLNLVGWVTMALFGIYYHLVPAAARGLLARLHLAAATAGVWLLVPGIVLTLTGVDDMLVKIGSLLTVVSILLFVAVVVRTRAPSRARRAEQPVPA